MSEPAWYADPGGGEDFRWWDGRRWTAWRSSSATPAPPDPTGPAAGPGVRLSAAVGIIVAALLLAMIAVGGLVAYSAQRAPRIVPLDPPSAAAGPPELDWNPTSRLLAVEEMHVTAPSAPFNCLASPVEVPGLFRQMINCDADVHRNYNARGDDWTASTGLGVLARSAVGDDLGQTADQVLAGILDAFYAGTKLTVTKRQRNPLTIAPTGHAVLLSCTASYAGKGVPSRSDRVVIALVELQSGAYAAWYAAVPNDTPTNLRKLLTASADTVTAK